LRLAHEAKPPIIHRDLKPANVLITRNGFLKVSDFGVAVDQREALLEGGGGTITYAPPELSSGAPATPAYDIYALGVTMLEFLRGRNPLNEVSARAREQGAATAARKGLGKPEKGTPYIEQYVGLEIERAKEKLARLEDPETGQPLVEQCAELKLAKRVQEALRRCLAIHPEDRYAGASELDQDLAACQTPAGQINRRVVTAQREAQNTLDAARQHLEWDDAEETARELLDLLKREPRNAEALFLLATVYEKQGKLEDACRRQKEGSEIKETSASLRRLAELYQAAGKQAKANTTLLRAELKETTEQ
jgi:serine/threonine protein kinase